MEVNIHCLHGGDRVCVVENKIPSDVRVAKAAVTQKLIITSSDVFHELVRFYSLSFGPINELGLITDEEGDISYYEVKWVRA